MVLYESSYSARPRRADDIVTQEEMLDEGILLQAIHQSVDVQWANDHFAKIESAIRIDDTFAVVDEWRPVVWLFAQDRLRSFREQLVGLLRQELVVPILLEVMKKRC